MTYLSASMKQTVAVKKIKTMKMQIGKNKHRIESTLRQYFFAYLHRNQKINNFNYSYLKH